MDQTNEFHFVSNDVYRLHRANVSNIYPMNESLLIGGACGM